jgi:hypothetical protein
MCCSLSPPPPPLLSSSSDHVFTWHNWTWVVIRDCWKVECCLMRCMYSAVSEMLERPDGAMFSGVVVEVTCRRQMLWMLAWIMCNGSGKRNHVRWTWKRFLFSFYLQFGKMSMWALCSLLFGDKAGVEWKWSSISIFWDSPMLVLRGRGLLWREKRYPTVVDPLAIKWGLHVSLL